MEVATTAIWVSAIATTGAVQTSSDMASSCSGASGSPGFELGDSGAPLGLGGRGGPELRRRLLDEGAGLVPNRPDPPRRVPARRHDLECHIRAGANACGIRGHLGLGEAGERSCREPPARTCAG